jgi:hypothetical protein
MYPRDLLPHHPYSRRTVVLQSKRPSALVSNLYDVSTDDHDLAVYKTGCDPEVWPPLAAISHLATCWQGGRLNPNWLTPPFVPLRSVRRIRDAFSYFIKINIPISSFDDQLFFQVVVLLSIYWQRKNRV